MCSLERDVVSKDLWKNVRAWHNRVRVVPWYNLYITINNIFLSERGEITIFTFSYSIFTLLDLSVWLPSVLVPHITSAPTPFILSIFSLSSHVSSSFSFVMSAKYQGTRRSGIWQDNLGDEDLNYCHRCHTKTALWCFSSLLCICECLSMSQLIKMKWCDHYWYFFLPQLVSYVWLQPYDFLIFPKMIVILHILSFSSRSIFINHICHVPENQPDRVS